MSSEIFSRREGLIDRVWAYFPPKEILEEYKNPRYKNREVEAVAKKEFPGAKYALVNLSGTDRFVIVPVWHDLNFELEETPGKHYGQTIFEGMSVEPETDSLGNITGANLVLFEDRIKRFERSSLSQGLKIPFSVSSFSQAIKDLIAISGEDILRDKEGSPSRAYLRPALTRGKGRWGVTGSPDQENTASVFVWNWAHYLKDPERIYKGDGLVVAAFLDEQRLSKIHGKEAGNYSHAGVVGKRARNLGADEALYFGPYLIRPVLKAIRYINFQEGERAQEKIRKYGVIADGPGEDVAAVTRSGRIIYPPLNVNRLSGTTLNYLVKYLAPGMGVETRENPFSLEDIRRGEIVSLMFTGNAARIAPIGQIRVYDSGNKVLETLNLKISPIVRRIVGQYENEVRGVVAPSHNSLLTPINLEEGREARKILDEIYKGWF